MKEIAFEYTGFSSVLLRKVGNDEDVLLLKRTSSNFNKVWCYIGGGIQEGETEVEAARREIVEETSLVPLQLYLANKIE